MIAGQRERREASLQRNLEASWKRVEEAQDRILKMTEPAFVLQHLRQQGVGPYLVAASERVTQDVEAVKKILHCDESAAIAYLIRGTIGQQPARSQPD